MSWKRTLALVIVAALLGGYYYWYEVKGGEQRKAAEEAAQRIFQLQKDTIEAVTISRGPSGVTVANPVWIGSSGSSRRSSREPRPGGVVLTIAEAEVLAGPGSSRCVPNARARRR